MPPSRSRLQHRQPTRPDIGVISINSKQGSIEQQPIKNPHPITSSRIPQIWRQTSPRRFWGTETILTCPKWTALDWTMSSKPHLCPQWHRGRPCHYLSLHADPEPGEVVVSTGGRRGSWAANAFRSFDGLMEGMAFTDQECWCCSLCSVSPLHDRISPVTMIISCLWNQQHQDPADRHSSGTLCGDPQHCRYRNDGGWVVGGGGKPCLTPNSLARQILERCKADLGESAKEVVSSMDRMQSHS
jgi:hypothetical protein